MNGRFDSGGNSPGGEPDEVTARLLRLAGARSAVPPEREARLRQAFLDEVRAARRARAARRRAQIAGGALAAAALVLTVRLLLQRPAAPPQAVIVGRVERVEGVARVDAGENGDLPIRAAQAIHEGHTIATDADGRLALRLNDGVSVRLDRGTRVRLIAASILELAHGALYVDSGAATPQMEVRTPFGAVRDIGTQFEVRLEEAAMRVRVRSGIVEVRRGTEVASARPGTELTLATGGITSRPVATHGPEWDWAAALAPPLEMEGRTLDAVLRQMCREQGWTLAYADPSLARDASGIILHGSTAGLRTSDALAVVLATTGLTHELEGGELRVARAVAR